MKADERAFSGAYKEVITMTAEILDAGFTNEIMATADLIWFLMSRRLKKDDHKTKQYFTILRCLGHKVSRRKGEWYFYGEKVEFYENI